jgi:hypothetical protein
MLIFLRAAAVSQWRREDAQTYGFPGMIVPRVMVTVVILVGVEEIIDVNRGASERQILDLAKFIVSSNR